MKAHWEESETRQWLKAIIITNPAPDMPTVKTIADSMRINENTLYKILDGTIELGYDRIKHLVEATKHPDTLRYFIASTAELKITKSRVHDRSDIRDDMLLLINRAGSLAVQVRGRSLSPDGINAALQSLRDIEDALESTRQELVALKRDIA